MRARVARPGRPEREAYFDTEQVRTGLGGRTARGGAFTTAGQAVKFFIQTVSNIVLARLLTPDDFGIVAMVTSVTGVVVAVKDLGLTAATIQKKEVNHVQVSTLFWVNAAFSAAIVLLVAASSPLFVMWYGRPEVQWVTVAIGISFFPLGLGAQHQAILSRQMKFGRLVTVELASMVLAVTCAIVAAALGASYWALVLHLVVLNTALGTGYWIASGWIPGLPRRGAGVRSMISFGGHMTGFKVINYLSRRLDQVLLGKTVGATALGYYERAYKLLLLPLSQINQPIGNVVIPALSRLQNEPERYCNYYLRALRIIGLVTMPAVTMTIIMAPELIRVLLGPQWDQTAPLFSILGISALMTPFANATGWLFTSQGRAGEMFRWGLISGGIAALAIVAGLPWGTIGVAWGVTIGLVAVRIPLLFWYVGRKGPVGIRELWGLLPFPVTVSAAVAATVALFRFYGRLGQPLADLLIAAGIALAAGAAVLLILPAGRRTLRDLRYVLRVLFAESQ